MNSITQDMKYRQSLLTYAQKYGVSCAVPAGSTTKAGLTSTSGVPATTVPCNPWPAGPGVLTATPTGIPKKRSSSSLICTDKTSTWES